MQILDSDIFIHPNDEGLALRPTVIQHLHDGRRQVTVWIPLQVSSHRGGFFSGHCCTLFDLGDPVGSFSECMKQAFGPDFCAVQVKTD